MQIRYFLPVLLVMLLLSVCVSAQDAADQDSTGLPGDNFSLQGALEMFKQSASPEAFEKALNSEENKVNNLDLNADGDIDYIRVVNKKEDNIQLFVLQAVVSEDESQDIAVISLEKTGDENAVIQIEGDKDIYGEAKIAEPAPEADNAFNYSPATHGPSAYNVSSPSAIFVNVWFWPCVRFCYAPSYVIWTSPWGWHSHPGWWRPWRPMPWHYYRPAYYRYNTRYVVVYNRRIAPARTMYRPMRRSSVTVINRNRVVVNNYRSTRGYQPSRVTNGNAGGRNYNNNGGRNYQPSRVTNGNAGGRTYQPSGTTQPSRNYQPSRSATRPSGNYQNNGGRTYQSRPSNNGGGRSQPGRSSGGRSGGGRSSSGRSGH